MRPSHFFRPRCSRFRHRLIKLILQLQIRKGIYYSLVTTSEFEPEADSLDLGNSIDASSSPPLKSRHVLPLADVERCRSLMNGIVEHFTPVLFTPVRVPVI